MQFPDRIIAGLLAFALAFFPPLAFGQSAVLNGFPPGTFQSRAAIDAPISGGAYSGPGNVQTGALAFYSCGRAYNAAYAVGGTQPACDIVDTATGLATCTIPIGTNGFANLTAIVCPTSAPAVGVTTFCTVTHAAGCSVAKMYDQSGSLACSGGTACSAVQATLANMPPLTLSALNGLPCPTWAGASAMVLASGVLTSTTNMPFAYTAVSKSTVGTPSATSVIVENNGNTTNIGYRASANTVGSQSGTITATASANSFHAVQLALVSTGANASFIVVDGSQTLGTFGSFTLTNKIAVGNGDAGGNPLTGTICEAGVWPSNFTSVYTSMNTNMHSATNGWNF